MHAHYCHKNSFEIHLYTNKPNVLTEELITKNSATSATRFFVASRPGRSLSATNGLVSRLELLCVCVPSLHFLPFSRDIFFNVDAVAIRTSHCLFSVKTKNCFIFAKSAKR